MKVDKRNITKKGVRYKQRMFWADFMKELHGNQVLVEPMDEHSIAIYIRRELLGIATEVGIKERKCRVCGCTWNDACEGGCYWVEKDLCSRCAGKEVKKCKRNK